jgi:hypothetical protein
VVAVRLCEPLCASFPREYHAARRASLVEDIRVPDARGLVDNSCVFGTHCGDMIEG